MIESKMVVLKMMVTFKKVSFKINEKLLLFTVTAATPL